MRLYHVSDQADIPVFKPRIPPTPTPTTSDPVVWAVDEARLVNYLVPRDCPRVAFYATSATTPDDRCRFLVAGLSSHVVAIEAGWLQRAIDAVLWLYELPPHSFVCADQTAGYFVSPVAVVPTSIRRVASPLLSLASFGAELRVMPDLRPLAAEIAKSSLAFSCIRMRNTAT
jgi:hypothetical protein